jgi:hypothetical protein
MNGSLLVAKMVKLFLKIDEWRILGRKDQLRLQLHSISASVSKVITATAILKLIELIK